MDDSFNNKQIPLAQNGSFFTGHLNDFQKNPLHFMQNLTSEYGSIVRFRLGPLHKVILLSDPELIKEVLVTKQKSFIKSKDVQSLKALVGEGLLTSEKEVHMQQRRLIQPAFKKTHINLYAQDMIDITEKYIGKWNDGMETEVTEDMLDITLGIISKTMFSMDFKEGHERLGDSVENGMKLAIKRMRSIIPLPLWIPSKTNREFKQVTQALDEVLFSIIGNRRQEDSPKEDLLGILMAAREENHGTGMTDQQLRDELMTIFLAGHETTANALSWTLYLLSQHPEVEEKLHKEIDSIIGTETLNPEHFQMLTYTQNVIWESLRLYPPAYVIGRQVDEDVEIGGFLFKKGETVFMSQYVIHRQADHFEEPDTFKPERFENNFMKTLPTYAYFPFGGGPRVCIGNHFAFMEMVLVLACIARRYRLLLSPNHKIIKPQPLITLRPKPGLKMRLEKRNSET
ncbi:Cytochrome P450 [Mesobacillus persicus]|uniref:Cytochrome P450 n=1 Tax=Mesobacillus persicus TaxID=930146 RepID=A0A1H8CQH3_9BACI|nr:cytochrome P450 [Mesobacillus persicus]SEM97260.1 Cytochrome P450 [Mesobacillus persicus]